MLVFLETLGHVEFIFLWTFFFNPHRGGHIGYSKWLPYTLI